MKYFLLLFVAHTLVMGAPAFEHRKWFRQPDGSAFIGTPKGDEHLQWIESDEGEILIYVKERRRYEPAEIDQNNLRGTGTPFKASTNPREKVDKSGEKRISKDVLLMLWKNKRRENHQKMHHHQ